MKFRCRVPLSDSDDFVVKVLGSAATFYVGQTFRLGSFSCRVLAVALLTLVTLDLDLHVATEYHKS